MPHVSLGHSHIKRTISDEAVIEIQGESSQLFVRCYAPPLSWWVHRQRCSSAVWWVQPYADPAPLPAPNIGEQLLTSVAGAPQLLQGLLGGQPATPPPLASAAIRVPQTAGARPARNRLCPTRRLVAVSRRHHHGSGSDFCTRNGDSRVDTDGAGGDFRARTGHSRVDPDGAGCGGAATGSAGLLPQASSTCRKCRSCRCLCRSRCRYPAT